jgi:tetratricopeptide (TPR) repeat protein
MITVLFLAAKPLDTGDIRLDEEYREIEDRLSHASPQRFRLIGKWAVRAQDLQKALLEYEPAIVHISGHGDEDGRVLLENANGYSEPVEPEALAELFRVFASSIQCVVLNLCNSARQAKEIVRFVDAAVGMEGSISTGAGRAFVTAFYQALAYGKDVATAFDFGRNQISLEDNPGEEEIPQLYIRESLDRVFPADTIVPLDQREAALEALFQKQLSLASVALGASEKVRLTPTYQEVDPPPIVENCSMRTETVTQIECKLAGKCWYALHGAIASGKTHLAALLTRKRDGRCIWVRLRGLAAAECLSVIDGTLSSIKQRVPGQSKGSWYEECCAVLGSDGVVVLDDLPRTSGRDDLDDSLIFLGRAARKTRVTLISISSVPLPQVITAGVSDAILPEAAPAFTLNDVIELLAAHGAPEAFRNEAWAGAISTLCRQHPLLLTEAVRFLAGKEWKPSTQVLQEVIRGEYAVDLEAQSQDHLLRTVPDPETRELLYRLRVVAGSFSSNDVREIASVLKSVSRPIERLSSLLGLWVQRDGIDRYVLSPLVSLIAASNLEKQTEKQVHRYCAARLMRQRPITPIRAVAAIAHYAAAELFEDAGSILLSSLAGYLKARKPKDEFLLSEFWSHIPLPAEMPLPLRVSIRAMQISVYHEKGKDPSALITDLEKLLATEKLPPELQPYDALLGGIVGVALWSRKPAEAVGNAVKSLKSLRAAPPEIMGRRSNRLRLSYYDLLWSAISQVQAESVLRACIDHLSELTSAELHRWVERPLADLGAEMLCNSLWMTQHDKPQADRDWESVLRGLALLRNWARERSLTVLFAWSQWATVVVLAEYLNRLNDAVILGEQAISECHGNPKALFWLNDILGREYYYVQRWQESLTFLVRCADSVAEVKVEKRAHATVLAGIAAAKLRKPLALTLLSRAAAIARSYPQDVPPSLAASIHTELAFEQWQQADRTGAFESLSQAAEVLLGQTKTDDDWKITFTLFGNFAGFFCWDTREGSQTLWSYAKPEAGLMLDRSPDILKVFDPAKLYVIAAQLTLLAEGLGLPDRALRWARRADLAKFDVTCNAVMSPYRAAAHVADERFAEAIEESWTTYMAGMNSQTADQQDLGVRIHVGKTSVAIVMFALAAARVTHGSDEAKKIASSLDAIVRRLTNSNLDQFWTAFVELAHHIANGDRNSRTLYEVGIEWEKRGELHLGIICRIAALTSAAPKEAFHLTMCSFRKKLIRWVGDTPFASVIIPFLRSYWQWALTTYSFHFSRPEGTKAEVQSAFSTPGEAGLRQALRIIADALSIRVTDDYREYLAGTDR